VISGPIVKRSLQTDNLEIADRSMRKIASEFVARGANTSPREIASVLGDSSKQDLLDPWGQPFTQVIVRNSYGQPTHVLVWSLGPNGMIDTQDLKPKENSGVIAIVFDGDDIGVLRSLR
jgi:hypothetical protein